MKTSERMVNIFAMQVVPCFVEALSLKGPCSTFLKYH